MTAAEKIGGWLRAIGSSFSKIVGLVNPDVWRELGYAALSSYSVLLPRTEEILERAKDEYPPVILVHGLGANRGAWWPLRLFLKINGHKRIYAFNYVHGTIQEHARQLVSFIQKVLAVTGENKVDLVAHSLGGIVTRYAAQRLGVADQIRYIITLASPNQGTYAAHYANSNLTRPLLPESDLLKDLNRDDLKACPFRLITLHSDRDVYIIPALNMTHPDAVNIFLPDVSHSQYLVSPAVFRLIEKKLTEGVHSPP